MRAGCVRGSGADGPPTQTHGVGARFETGDASTPTPPLAKFRLTAPEPSERDIHVACRDLLNLCLAPPAQWAPYPAGVTVLTAQQFAQYSRFGLKRGLPDIWIFWGKIFAIELKRRKGRLSKTRVGRSARGGPRELIGQEDMFPKLLATGAFGAIEVAHSVDEVCELLDRWQIPRLGGKSWLGGVRPMLNGQQPAGTSEKHVGGDSA